MVQVHENISLLPYNTFGFDVRARYFAEVRQESDLMELMTHPSWRHPDRLVLGGGSNILFTRDVNGLVVKACFKGITAEAASGDEIHVTAGSGEEWHDLVMYCLSHGWGGLENLSLIPGTVGAAPIQNIGAYGVELQNVLIAVNGIHLEDGSMRRLTASECQFGYRDSIFKHTFSKKIFISSITLRLTQNKHRLHTEYGAIRNVLTEQKIDSPTIRDISDAVIHIRKSKLPDPRVTGNAGSFFKNPTVPHEKVLKLQEGYPKIPVYEVDNQQFKIAAGWLIEQCGWKGKRIGAVGVHPEQALVLVHYGGGKGEEILALSHQIQSDVKKKFDVDLTPEVNIF